MRLATLACALLVACGELPNGISIQVVPVEGVTSVELFIGKNCSGRCPGQVRPPMFNAEMPSRLFEVANDGVWTGTLEDGVAGFRIVNDGTDEATVHVLVAVGYNASGEAIATAVLENVTISPTTSELYEIQLAPASPIVEGETPPSDEYRITRWKTTDDLLPSCVVIEHGAEPRIALGPESDTDCDEVAIEPECAPWTYLAREVPGTIETASCTSRVANYEGTGFEACLAASPLCDEVTGVDPATCQRLAEDYCLPSALCTCISGGAWDPVCLRGKVENAALGETSFVVCTVGTRTATEACASPTYFDLFSLIPLLTPTTSMCDDVTMREVGATFGPLDGSANFPSAGIVIKEFDKADCAIAIEWKGIPDDRPHVALLSLDLDNGKHVVVPLVIRYGQFCDTTPMCSVYSAPGERARLCAELPPVQPATCAPASLCHDGPPCGGTCCGAGERCVNNVCMCGAEQSFCSSAAPCRVGLDAAGCGSQCCTDNSQCF